MDKIFLERIKVLLKIAIPSYKSREFIYVVVLTGLLVIRTYMSIWLADVNGQIVKAIVNRSLSEFLKRVCIFIKRIIITIIDLWTHAIRYTLINS